MRFSKGQQVTWDGEHFRVLRVYARGYVIDNARNHPMLARDEELTEGWV